MLHFYSNKIFKILLESFGLVVIVLWRQNCAWLESSFDEVFVSWKAVSWCDISISTKHCKILSGWSGLVLMMLWPQNSAWLESSFDEVFVSWNVLNNNKGLYEKAVTWCDISISTKNCKILSGWTGLVLMMLWPQNWGWLHSSFAEEFWATKL